MTPKGSGPGWPRGERHRNAKFTNRQVQLERQQAAATRRRHGGKLPPGWTEKRAGWRLMTRQAYEAMLFRESYQCVPGGLRRSRRSPQQARTR